MAERTFAASMHPSALAAPCLYIGTGPRLQSRLRRDAPAYAINTSTEYIQSASFSSSAPTTTAQQHQQTATMNGCCTFACTSHNTTEGDRRLLPPLLPSSKQSRTRTNSESTIHRFTTHPTRRTATRDVCPQMPRPPERLSDTSYRFDFSWSPGTLMISADLVYFPSKTPLSLGAHELRLSATTKPSSSPP